MLSMLSSHVGSDKWEQLMKDKTLFISMTKWNGRIYSLERFTSTHRSSFVQLEEASQHVDFQLLSEHSRVGYLIDNIDHPDPDLRAAIAAIRMNNNGMRSNFELAVSCLLPVDPYIKSKKYLNAKVSDANALQNKTNSKTGVDLRWHKPEEYRQLSKDQRNEIYEWQQSNKDKTGKQKSNANHKPKMSARKKLKSH